jgi:hypothetical protein
MRTTAAIVLALLTFAGQLRSQTPQPAFEVAAVRTNTSVSARILMDGSGGRYTVKLTGERGPVDVLVIDSVSPPTEN